MIKLNFLALVFVLMSYAKLDADLPALVKVRDGLYAEINAPALKILMDSGLPLVVLDARKSTGGKKIPRSIPMKYDVSAEEIARLIPSKETLIIVYCEDIKCPEDAYLASHLNKLGYRNVIEFSAGIDSWIEQNYPVERVN